MIWSWLSLCETAAARLSTLYSLSSVKNAFASIEMVWWLCEFYDFSSFIIWSSSSLAPYLRTFFSFAARSAPFSLVRAAVLIRYPSLRVCHCNNENKAALFESRIYIFISPVPYAFGFVLLSLNCLCYSHLPHSTALWHSVPCDERNSFVRRNRNRSSWKSRNVRPIYHCSTLRMSPKSFCMVEMAKSTTSRHVHAKLARAAAGHWSARSKLS